MKKSKYEDICKVDELLREALSADRATRAEFEKLAIVVLEITKTINEVQEPPLSDMAKLDAIKHRIKWFQMVSGFVYE